MHCVAQQRHERRALDPRACSWPVDQEKVRLRAYFISLENPGRNPQENWDQALAEFQAAMGCRPPKRVGFYPW